MPAKRELTMRQLRQMLRLHHDGVSAREIGRTLGVARSTIQDNLGRAGRPGSAGRCRPNGPTRFSNSGCLPAAASSPAAAGTANRTGRRWRVSSSGRAST